MRRVRILSKARADLKHIAEYIGNDDTRRAASYVLELREKINGLIQMADAFPLIARMEHLGVRRRTHGPYRIFYRIVSRQQVIEVLRVMHSARDAELDSMF